MTDDVRRPISVDPSISDPLLDDASQNITPVTLLQSLSIDISFHDDAWEKLLFKCFDGTEPEKFFDDLVARIIEASLQEISLVSSKSINDSISLFVSLSLMNNDQVHELNKQYRNKDKPTNVLSFESGQDTNALFSSLEEEGVRDSPPLLLGDIILAYGVIEQESKEQQKDFLDHLTHMMTHSILHLLGYDHEEEIKADEMEALEIQILEKHFNIKNPYLSGNNATGES